MNPHRWADIYHCSKPTHNGVELYLCDITQNVITPTVKLGAVATVEAFKISFNLVDYVAKLAGEIL